MYPSGNIMFRFIITFIHKEWHNNVETFDCPSRLFTTSGQKSRIIEGLGYERSDDVHPENARALLSVLAIAI